MNKLQPPLSSGRDMGTLVALTRAATGFHQLMTKFVREREVGKSWSRVCGGQSNGKALRLSE